MSIERRVVGAAGVLIQARFVASPIGDVKTRLSKEGEENKSDVANLEKKLNYLETTYKNSREHLEQLFKSGGR